MISWKEKRLPSSEAITPYNTGAQGKQMLLLYAITRSTRRQNETSMSQFRERQDIAFHSSALHLHAAHQDTQVSLHPTPRADARQIWAHQQSGIQCVVTQPRSPISATVSLSVPHGPHIGSVAQLSQNHNTDCPSTGQPAKAIVLRTTCKVSCSQEGSLVTAPLGKLGTCPKCGTCGTDTLHGYTRPVMRSFPSGQGASHCERKAYPNSDWPLVNTCEKPLKTVMKMKFLWNMSTMWKFASVAGIFGYVPNVRAKRPPWDPEQLFWIEKHLSGHSLVLSWHQPPPCNPLQKNYTRSSVFPPLPPPVSLKENSANEIEHNTNSINKQIEIHVPFNSFHKIQHRMLVRLKVPVSVSVDITTAPEHPSQGLTLFIYSMAQPQHWIPT